MADDDRSVVHSVGPLTDCQVRSALASKAKLVAGSDLPWYDDRDELVAFARFLVEDEDAMVESRDLLYYFEKPWKWSEERDAWVARGRP